MKLLRKALENGNEVPAVVNPEEATVVMQGPLSEVYTKALNVALAKKDPATGEAVMESQANDAIMQANILSNIKIVDYVDTDNKATTIYGVSQNNITPNVITNVVTKFVAPETNLEDFIIVCDATNMVNDPTNSNGTDNNVIRPATDANEKMDDLIPVLESLATKYGVRIVHSLEEAIKLIK